jgi:hypothetical protein
MCRCESAKIHKIFEVALYTQIAHPIIPMAMSSRRVCGCGAGTGVVLSTLLITAGLVPQRHYLRTLLDWSPFVASYLTTIVSRQPQRTWLEETFAMQPSMGLHASGESFRGRHNRDGQQVEATLHVRTNHWVESRQHGPMVSATTESPKQILSLVVPLRQAGLDVVEQLSFLVHAASSKLAMERLLTVELELVVDSDRKDTAELRHLFPNLNEQVVWLETSDAQQVYRATAARQERWLRERYPDDNVQLVSTEATLNVAHPDRYVDTARHVSLLLRHQSESKSPIYPPPPQPGQIVSLPFLVSTGKIASAVSLGTYLQQQRQLPHSLFRIDESTCAALRHSNVEMVSLCTRTPLLPT